MHNFIAFDSIEKASGALAGHIAARLEAAIRQRGEASIVVCGGTSPQATFQALRRYKLVWNSVTILPTDERLLAPDHADSNTGMIRNELMREEAGAATLLSLAHSGIPDQAWLANLNTRLQTLARPLDLVLLGMGEDGHTASLFPDSPDIAAALKCRKYSVVQQPAHLDIARLSLTPKLLLDAREIVLLFFGVEKRCVYEQAIAGNDARKMPVRFVLNQDDTPVSIYWAS